MHFQVAAAIRLDRGLDRLVDELDAGADWYLLEQILDVVVTQPHAAVAHPQTYAELGIGTVDGVHLADVERKQPHGVVRASRPDRRQCLATGGVLGMHLGGWGPGRACLLALHAGHPVFRGVGAELAYADGQHFHHLLAFRVVVESHLGDVQHYALAGGIRQDQLVRHDQLLARLQQQGIRLGVGFQHVGQTELELGRDRFQGLARLFGRHHVFQVLAHQAAVGRRQGIFDGKPGGGQEQAAAQCGRRVVEELHNFPVI